MSLLDPCGCGAKICTPNGTLVNGKLDYNLRSPGGLILTHTHVSSPYRFVARVCPRKAPCARLRQAQRSGGVSGSVSSTGPPRPSRSTKTYGRRAAASFPGYAYAYYVDLIMYISRYMAVGQKWVPKMKPDI